MKASDINPAYLKRHGIEAPKRSKYGNVKTEYGNVLYDSALEANAAALLDTLQTLGVVVRWERQVAFDLGSGISYRADFVVHYRTGQPRTLDLKGVETPTFRLKRKLFESLYGPLLVLGNWRDMPTEGRA